MAKPIHMFELPVEIEPFRPGVERGTSLMSHIVVSAAVVAFCARVTVAPAKLLEDLSGPPVEMGIDDPHGVALSSKRITHRKAILSSRHDAESRNSSGKSLPRLAVCGTEVNKPNRVDYGPVLGADAFMLTA